MTDNPRVRQRSVFFIRVKDGAVIEKGWTDPAAFAIQNAAEDYVEITREQHDTINLGDPPPEG